MPLAIGAHLGGMATLLSTSNILVAEALHEAGLEPFSLLDLLPIGLPLILVGITYMLLVGRRSLPATGPIEQYATAQQVRRGLVQTYALRERLHEVFVPTRARAAGRTIEEARIGEQLGLSILAIVRDGAQVATAPGPDRMLRAGDTLLVAGRTERVGKLAELGLEVLEALPTDNQLSTQAVTLVEVVLAPRSQAAGRTLRDLRFRERYGLGVVALWRGGRPYRTDVGDMALRFGDALLVHGPRDRVPVLRADPDFLVLTEAGEPPRPRKAWLAGAIMGLALGAAAFNLLPMSIALVAGALSMVVTACLTMDEAYRAVEWQAIFLLAGMLPLSIALSTSGAAQWLAEGLAQAAAGGGPLALAGGMLLLAAALTQVISGQATAVVLTPIAIAAAQHAEADPRPIAVAVALGCGMAFLTPTAHSANTLVAGPGGYRFRDYLRVGLPLVLVEIAAALVLLPLFWPLRL
jgi:di/tricarboxylate transporter